VLNASSLPVNLVDNFVIDPALHRLHVRQYNTDGHGEAIAPASAGLRRGGFPRIRVPQQGASNLATKTIIFGIVLILLGVAVFFGTGRDALIVLIIPAVFGLLLVIFGVLVALSLAVTTIGFGIALILLGLGGYFGTDRISLTALIPAAFGLPLVILGALARDEKRRKMAMHIAVTLGLLGFLGTMSGLGKVFWMLFGAPADRPDAEFAKSVMALLMAVYVAMCVKSFIDARRRRAGA
jgi:hypothetical protein